MKKKLNLAEALNKESSELKSVQKTTKVAKKISEVTTLRPPSRKDKKALTTWHDPYTIKQLKQIGLDTDASIQEMIREALNDFFTKNGKAQIA